MTDDRPGGCPSDTLLLAARRGELEPDEAEGLNRHLVGCEGCKARYEAVTASPSEVQTPDTVARFVQSNLVSPPPGVEPPHHPGDLGFIDGIRLLRKLGSGGAATVYLGRVGRTGETVAVKVLHPGAPDEVRARLDREATAGAELKDAGHVVRVIAPDGGYPVPYLKMDFTPGETLEERLRRTPEGRLPVGEAAAVARDVARGLAEMHALSWVHQDVTPKNVYLPDPAERGKPRAMLLDLGSAFKFGAAGPPRARTEGYASPEQRQKAGDISPSTDLFSLGVTLCRMLSGKLPATHDPEELGRWLLGLRVDSDLIEICLGCLRVEPKSRPRAAGVAAALTHHLERGPRLRKTARNWLLSLLVLATGFGGIHCYQAHREAVTRAERRAEALAEVLELREQLVAQLGEQQAARFAAAERMIRGGGKELKPPPPITSEDCRRTAERIVVLVKQLWDGPDAALKDREHLGLRSAYALATRVVEANPALPGAGFSPDELDRLNREQRGHEKNLARANLAVAMELQEKREWARAIGYYREAARLEALSPPNGTTVVGLAICLHALGRKEEAVASWAETIDLLKALDISGPARGKVRTLLATGLLHRGLIRMEMGAEDKKLALKDLSEARTLFQSRLDEREGLVRSLLVVATIGEATLREEGGEAASVLELTRQLLDLTLEAGPDMRTVGYWNAAGLYERVATKLTGKEQASANYERALALTRLANELVESGEAPSTAIAQSETAAATIEKIPAADLAPELRSNALAGTYLIRGRARFGLAMWAWGFGDKPDAIRELDLALEASTRAADIADRSRVLQRAAAGGAALETYLQTEQIHAHSLMLRAMVHAARSRWEKAEADLERVIADLDRLVNREGRRVLLERLVEAHTQREAVRARRKPSPFDRE